MKLNWSHQFWKSWVWGELRYCNHSSVYPNLGGVLSVMVIIVGNGHDDTIKILDEADCISHSTNTLGKGMNPIILPPAMGRLGSSALVRQLVYEKENSEFKPVKLRLKKIDLVSYPAQAEGLVNMYTQT